MLLRCAPPVDPALPGSRSLRFPASSDRLPHVEQRCGESGARALGFSMRFTGSHAGGIRGCGISVWTFDGAAALQPEPSLADGEPANALRDDCSRTHRTNSTRAFAIARG